MCVFAITLYKEGNEPSQNIFCSSSKNWEKNNVSNEGTCFEMLCWFLLTYQIGYLVESYDEYERWFVWIHRRGCLLGGVYVPCINRMPGGVIVGDSGLCCCVPVVHVMLIVWALLIPFVCLIQHSSNVHEIIRCHCWSVASLIFALPGAVSACSVGSLSVLRNTLIFKIVIISTGHFRTKSLIHTFNFDLVCLLDQTRFEKAS